MMNQVIAKIRLAPGQVGFYDELTRIHLSIANPEKSVLSGMNTTNIKKGVHSGRLRLISGLLEPEKRVVVKDVNVTKEESKAVAPAKAEKKAPVKTPEPKAEEVKVEEPKVEEVKTEIKQEAKAEEVKAPTVEEAPVATEEQAEEKPAAKKPVKKK